MKKLLILSFLLLCSIALPSFSEEMQVIPVYFPDESWALLVDKYSYVLDKYDISDDNKQVYAIAFDQDAGVMMSIFMEKVKEKGTALDVRKKYFELAEKSPIKKSGIKMTEAKDKAMVEYMVEEYDGKKLDQKNVNIYMAQGDAWIDVHLSKANYKPADESLFDRIKNTLRIKEKYEPSVWETMGFGSHLFMGKKYSKAAEFFKKALDVKDSLKLLGRDNYIVLIDSLGMAYGISGDFKKSKEALEYGIKQFPEYPMFYYNLACTFAEMNDYDSTLKNLKQALKNKNNKLATEEFPDPKTDSSFKKYIDKKDFIQAIEEGLK